jgi:Putative prokaryotic signal transducing protein
MESRQKMVKVYTAQGEMEANVIKGLLDSCGIPSILTGNAALSMQPFVLDGMGRIDIMVDAAQADEARSIIESSATENPAGGSESNNDR